MNTTSSLSPALFDLLRKQPNTSLYGLIAGVLVFVASFLLLRSSSDGRIVDIGGFPVTTAWKFFSKRHEFMTNNLKKACGLPFRFCVLQHHVVYVLGNNARKSFFNDSSLNLREGYRILMGSAPLLENIDVKPDGVENGSDFVRRLNLLLKIDRITELLPIFLEDMNTRLLTLPVGNEGAINPFKEVNDLVFQMTVRMATCQELAQDPAKIQKMADLFWDIEKNATPARLLLPWLSSPSKKLNRKATEDLYLLFLQRVEDRRAAGADTSDAIDILIRNGDTDNDAVRVIMGVREHHVSLEPIGQGFAVSLAPNLVTGTKKYLGSLIWVDALLAFFS